MTDSEAADIYLEAVSQIPTLTEAEEALLTLRLRLNPEDAAARRRLGLANLQIPVMAARHFVGKSLPFIDLIQAGNNGLQYAVQVYQPDGRHRFGEYARRFVRLSIKRSLLRHLVCAEELILCRLYREPKALGAVLAQIRPEQFYTGLHAAVYELLTEQLPKGKCYDEVVSMLWFGRERRYLLEIPKRYEAYDITDEAIRRCAGALRQHRPQRVRCARRREDYVVLMRKPAHTYSLKEDIEKWQMKTSG